MRIRSLDALRGAIIVLMAIDHANALIGRGRLASEMWAGEWPAYAGDALAFLVRFVTHLSAPGFFLLMGAGMALFAAARRSQGWSRGRITGFFVLRGGLLIALQFALENPAWRFGQVGPPDGIVYVGVLYALGAGMVLGGLLVWFPPVVLAGISAALLLATEALLPASPSGLPVLQALLLVPGFATVGAGGLYVLYPLLPWLGVVGLGIAFGAWVREDADRALAAAGWIGLGALALFAILRIANGYGNIRPWGGRGWIDFFNLVKYPPALTFLLLTLGLDLLLLRLFTAIERTGSNLLNALVVYGRAPLLFYLLHLYLFAGLGQWISPAGMPAAQMFLYWFGGLVILLPVCWAFGEFKQTRPVDSLWRLF